MSSDWVGRIAPPTYVTDVDGGAHTLALGQQDELILFFASWCSASRSELDRLERIADKGLPGLQLYAVSVDEQKDEAKLLKLVSDHQHQDIIFGYSGNGIYDQAYRHFRGSELPLVVGIGANRKVVYVGDSVEDAVEVLGR